MRKHRIVATIASLLAVAVIMASCASADAKKIEGVKCDGDVATRISKTEVKLTEARKAAKESRRTPDEKPTAERVTTLEAQLDGLNACSKGASPTSTQVAANCPDPSWARTDSDKSGHRWFAGGIPSIAEAKTPDEAKAAAHDWFSAAKQDPVTLSGAAKYLLDRDVPQAELFDSSGCATQTAVDLVAEAEAALALSMFKAEQAPSNGYNSGASDSNVTSSAKPGVRGDRRAVKIVTPKGVIIWVMARCGNPVTANPHPLVPKGPTDETPPKCPPPVGVPPRFWDDERCVKLDTPFDYQQNESKARQDPQDNTTSGVDVGPTPGAPPRPHVPAPAPTTPKPGTPAPNPTPGGYDSGSPDGSGTPGGSTTNPDGSTSGGGSDPATDNPVDTGQGGNNSGTIPTPSW